ncbi:dihydrolipoyl dehydrogenase [Mobiluncus mulieris]|uniref:dihydrolipoyl dehydrogenase n=1 Tax=Mobiluncus mulieris TaxID=2052 RepID=UPI0021E2ADAD|nr:dihydrolipoyl dehydrogenase [Mobiluncus mulieris]MCV0010607.1 dihydrolipoyl dehydrogenase [Mobiluncus mulieris]
MRCHLKTWEFTLSEDLFDIVVLGGGNGGYACALRAANLGMAVALVEADKLGGTCLHRGCIPTKALLRAAEVADTVRESTAWGVTATFSGVDMLKVKEFQSEVIDKMYRGLQGLVKARHVELVSGRGYLTSPDTITVGDRVLRGKHIVLASGSFTKNLGMHLGTRIIGSEHAPFLDYVPGSVVILGGGVIGVEFASLWKSFGADVTIIEALPHLVPNEDTDVSKGLEKAFKSRGIKILTNTRFAAATEDASGVNVSTEDGQQLRADYLLVAIGRAPNTADMGYESQGISLNRGFVTTNERLHTGVGNIYAVGDIVSGPQLAHRAMMQGIFVAEEIAGLHPQVVPADNIPRVTFCEPEIASVGLTEEKAKEIYGAENIETAKSNMLGNAKSQMLRATGFVKLVRVKGGSIVGFHALGQRMGEQIGEGQLMVNWEAEATDLAFLTHAHPTQNEMIGEAAMALAGKPLHG